MLKHFPVTSTPRSGGVDVFTFEAEREYLGSFVAGVLPDSFSVTGQRWGNPIYNWENLQKRLYFLGK